MKRAALIDAICEQAYALRMQRRDTLPLRLWLSPEDERALIREHGRGQGVDIESTRVRRVLGMDVLVSGDIGDGEPVVEPARR